MWRGKIKRSDIIAIVAVIVTIIMASITIPIQQQTYQMAQEVFEANKPFQKPIINVEIIDFETNISEGIQTDIGLKSEDVCFTWDFYITLIFRNYGNGISQNTSYAVVMSDILGIKWTEPIGTYTTVNEIYPDTTSLMRVNATYTNCHLNEKYGVIYVENIEDKIAFIVKSQYYDKVTGDQKEQVYWFKYIISEDEVYPLTIKEKNILVQNYEITHDAKFDDLFDFS